MKKKEEKMYIPSVDKICVIWGGSHIAVNNTVKSVREPNSNNSWWLLKLTQIW